MNRGKEVLLEGIEHHTGNAVRAAWQIPLASRAVLSSVLVFNAGSDGHPEVDGAILAAGEQEVWILRIPAQSLAHRGMTSQGGARLDVFVVVNVPKDHASYRIR